jgi:hypothetical protein
MVGAGSEDWLESRMAEVLTDIATLTAELRELRGAVQGVDWPRAGAARSVDLAVPGPYRPDLPPPTPHRPAPPPPLARTVAGEESTFALRRARSPWVTLRVGGSVHRVSWRLLLQRPDSRLGRIALCSTEAQLTATGATYHPDTNSIFFNHRAKNFSDILDFYRSEALHISPLCCPIEYVEELTYWGLSETDLQPCCLKRWLDCKEEVEWEQGTEEEPELEFRPGESGLQQRLWDMFEHPHTSALARANGLVSIAAIVLSTIILTLDTLPYFHHHNAKIAGQFAPFVVIEICYMTYFSVEFLIRLIACPSKAAFGKNLMNWIDLLAILPYFITLLLNLHGITEAEGQAGEIIQDLDADISQTAQYFRLLKMARIVKALRIIRIFKLARHSNGLRALGNTMKANYRELGLLFLLIFMGAIMFASLVFIFEKDLEDTAFKTMFDAYWWAVITMTTVSSVLTSDLFYFFLQVGYGDISPTSAMGKILGCFCAIFGMLIIGLPVPIIGSSYTNFYLRQKRMDKIEILENNRKEKAVHIEMKVLK